MHVLPLPFGMALALLPRRDAQQLSRPKSISFPSRETNVRERILTESRYADIRQRAVV